MSAPDYSNDFLQPAIDQTLAASEPKVIDADGPAAYALVVPAGGRVELVKTDQFDHLREHPRRVEGTVQAQTVGSFERYVERHLTDATTIWVDADGARAVAVLDDHDAVNTDDAAPGWGKHRAELALRTTPEWDRWRSHDRQLMPQESFAELLEEGLTQIAEPAGAELLEIASTLSGATTANWRAGIRLGNGAVKLQFDEEVTARAGTNGELTIPAEFTLVLPVYEGEQPVTMTARLRYRINSGNVRLGYNLDNPERVRLDVLAGIAERLREKHPNTYLGSPRR